MACITKTNTGHCSHTQCPFADVIGMDCVDVRYNDQRGFCEIGFNCLEQCPFSYGPEFEIVAFKAFGVEEIKNEIITGTKYDLQF